jgi:hypothetical protein
MDKKEIDGLVKDIKSKFNIFVKTCKDYSASAWTKAINDILYQLANSNGRSYYQASKFHKKKGADNSEWLYDYLWFTNNDKDTLKNVQLIAESEWRNRNLKERDDYFYNIRYDFEKLLVSRVQFKLMIFEAGNSNEIKLFIEQLKQVIDNCELPKIDTESYYMFAVWDSAKKEFYYDLIIVY